MSPDDFLDRHVSLLPDGDADAIAELYASGGELLTLTGAQAGRDAIRQRFADFFDYHRSIASAEITHRQTTDGAAFATYRVTSERGTFDILNAFVLDGDACSRHFSNETNAHLDADEVQA